MTRARGALAAAFVLVGLVAFLAGRASVGDPPAPRAQATPTATATSTPASSSTPGASVVEGDGSLALGITEPNPNLLVPGGPETFARWQPDLADGIRPTYYRLVVEWDKLAAPDGSGFDVAQPNAGCLRTTPPCAAFDGIRAQLAAVKRAQQAHPGRFQLMVVFMYTPADLTAGPRGCERAGTEPRSRPIRADATGPYRAAVRAVLEEARRQGVEIPFWSPWNEPNHPFFLSPQRRACDGSARSASVPAYLRLLTAMRAELAAAGAQGRLVLGETAGFLRRTPNATTVQELIRALPRDVVCDAAAYGQHAYLGGDDPVRVVARELARFRCPRTPQIWVTETGAEVDRSDEASACRAVDARLRRWYADPRVTAAFQYTFREDDQYRTGLVSTDLATPFPALGLWKAWGARRDASTAPPRRGCA